MQVNQIYAILNDIMNEVTGQTVTVDDEPQITLQEDLSNIVDIGTMVFSNNWRDNYVRAMINRIGREVFVDRTYEGYAPSVLRDAWVIISLSSLRLFSKSSICTFMVS